MQARLIFLPLTALWLMACGPTAGARPHDMSTEQHLAVASREEAEARSHEDQATTARESERCQPRARSGVCWTSAEKHEREAEEHRRHAAEHRAAAQALRDAEAKACVGIEPDDRDISPFFHREDIARVTRLEETASKGAPKLRGATVVFRAVPGMTAEWLQGVVNCHLARNASMGHAMSGMEYCPLALKDVTATVTSTGDGFAVELRSADPAVAAEVLRRAEALVQR